MSGLEKSWVESSKHGWHGIIGFDLEGEGEPPEGLSIGMT